MNVQQPWQMAGVVVSESNNSAKPTEADEVQSDSAKSPAKPSPSPTSPSWSTGSSTTTPYANTHNKSGYAPP